MGMNMNMGLGFDKDDDGSGGGGVSMNLLPDGHTVTPAEYERMCQYLSTSGSALFLSFSLT